MNLLMKGLLLLVICITNISPIMAQAKYVDGYVWNYYAHIDEVHSDYNNDQAHSASVTASGDPVYRATSSRGGIRCGVSLKTKSSGKKAYYNYW